MRGQSRVLIIGAGLTGCTVAHALAREGIESVLLERASVPGGLVRSELMNGVIYEPHGSHVFHTEGTVLGFEFTGAPTRYYPIESEQNRSLNTRH